MAKEDYEVADRALQGADGKALTAGERVAQTVQETPDQEARDFAEAGDVALAAYRNYATALEAHQARVDIETLADRRAREYGADFEAGAFMRAGHSDTPPTSGGVNGVAPASGGPGAGGDDDQTGGGGTPPEEDPDNP